ncbi:hypothetical protein E4U21_001032 [Claviceps maximensis]|nr:hypothetical protein E4U21_001032 [Claviceps maximensis]
MSRVIGVQDNQRARLLRVYVWMESRRTTDNCICLSNAESHTTLTTTENGHQGQFENSRIPVRLIEMLISECRQQVPVPIVFTLTLQHLYSFAHFVSGEY